MQIDIDQESANKTLLTQQLQDAESQAVRNATKLAIVKANEKIETLMLLLLQYCAGLQHCLDQEEEQRQQASSLAAAAATSATASAIAADEPSISDLAPNGISSTEKEEAGAAVDEPEEVVAQVLTELIHKAEGDDDDDSLSEDEINVSDIGEEDLVVEHFRPVFQSQVVDVSRSKAAMRKAKATLEGCSEICVDSGDEGRELEDSTSLWRRIVWCYDNMAVILAPSWLMMDSMMLQWWWHPFHLCGVLQSPSVHCPLPPHSTF